MLILVMEKDNKVTLAFSCPFENDVTKNSNRIHCNKCSQDLVDFTSKSITEVRKGINAQEPVCGVFKKSQLSDCFLKYAAATVIVTSSVSFVGFGQDKISVMPGSETDSLQKSNDDVVFGMFLEVAAEPLGGYPKFFAALSKELKYPKGLTSTGKCFVEFVIDTTGSTKDYKIIRGVTPAIDQEVLRALKTLNYPWKPARHGNKAVTTRFIVPVLFDPARK